MDWVSFFIGCGVTVFVMLCVFVLMPAHSSTRESQAKQREDMQKLHSFWGLSNTTAAVRNDHLEDIAIELRRIVDKN